MILGGGAAPGWSTPHEKATWSPTILSIDQTTAHMHDSGHAYGLATFDVNPGNDRGGWTTMTLRYHRVLDPMNPDDADS